MDHKKRPEDSDGYVNEDWSDFSEGSETGDVYIGLDTQPKMMDMAYCNTHHQYYPTGAKCPRCL